VPSADQPAPSYDELVVLVAALHGKLDAVLADLAEARRQTADAVEALTQATAEIAELRARLKKTSKNSSKPPSSDGLAKPEPKSRREKTGRPVGGQPGHPGSTLALVADPEQTIAYEPVRCRRCGDALLLAQVVGFERRQVVDVTLPAGRTVIEHRLLERECAACGARTRAKAPDGVGAPVQYGEQVRALVLYLYGGQFLSRDRTAQAMAELFGIHLSTGTIVTMQARATATLEKEFLPLLRGLLREADVLGADETGLRVEGKLHWVHCARTDKLTLVTVHPRRGRVGITAADVLPGFTGTLVHDCWASYDIFLSADHQLCCAHVARELVAVAERYDPTAWCWATQALEALVDLQKLAVDARAAGQGAVDPADSADARHRLRSAVQAGIAQTQARTTSLMRDENNLAQRLATREADYLRFLTDTAVPADNNGSERDIRMVKLRQKISGCLRSLAGARHFAALRSYLSTARKHNLGLLDALARLTAGRPWLPENTPALTAAA
jgi:transposase